jgi:hypothetical protein
VEGLIADAPSPGHRWRETQFRNDLLTGCRFASVTFDHSLRRQIGGAMNTKTGGGGPVQTLATGLLLGESPRWYDDRLWFADWGAQELIAMDLAGRREVIVRVPSFPFCFDWLHDGQLLIVSARDRLLLRREPDGRLVTHADLGRLSDRPWNEIVVDGRGNALPRRSDGGVVRRRPEQAVRAGR